MFCLAAVAAAQSPEEKTANYLESIRHQPSLLMAFLQQMPVPIHYLYQVLRGFPREQVFAQILLGFELVKADPRFVGFNLVMPEDWYPPMHDFHLHMRMIEALRKFYPNTHISLHAGELAMGLVPPEGLRSHIRIEWNVLGQSGSVMAPR
jgi:hypothetical protein